MPFAKRDPPLECGDLSPLLLRGGLTPRSYLQENCDRSQLKSKAVTGHRTPKDNVLSVTVRLTAPSISNIGRGTTDVGHSTLDIGLIV
jgi:hypothetical protein